MAWYDEYKVKTPNMRPRDETKPQFREDQHGPGYRNEVPENSWLRGGGENAENKPGYVHGPRTKDAYPYNASKTRGSGILPSRLRDDPGPWLTDGKPRKK